MEPVPVIVQAVLVDEPNKHLIKSAKLIGMTYLTYYAYLFSNLITVSYTHLTLPTKRIV